MVVKRLILLSIFFGSILLATQSLAESVVVSLSNYSQFQLLRPEFRYACYIDHPRSVIGRINRSSLQLGAKFSGMSQAAQKTRQTVLNRKITELKASSSRLESDLKSRTKIIVKLKRLRLELKLLRSIKRKCAAALTNSPTPEPSPTATTSPLESPSASSTPTAAPTNTPSSPTPTPEPFSGRHYRHITTGAYFSIRPLIDQAEARFLAEHFDSYVGQVGTFDTYIRSIWPVKLVFMRSVRAIADIDQFSAWLSDKYSNYAPTFAEAFEKVFIHYRQDTTINLDWNGGATTIKGYRAECSPNCTPAATATQESQSRSPDTGPLLNWWVPNPIEPVWLDYQAYTLHQRNGWFQPEGVFFDWCAGANIQGENKLSKTHQYAGVDESDPFAHPFVADSISVIDSTRNLHAQRYPNEHQIDFFSCNTVAPYWTYEHSGPGSNDYRTKLLASSVDLFFYENWMRFGDENPFNNSTYPSVDVHLKYLKDTIALAQFKKIGLMVIAEGPAASEREKIFLYSLALLVQDPERFEVVYRFPTGEEDFSRRLSEWMWFPGMEYDIGLPDTIPTGKIDILGQSATTNFYEYDPPNPNYSLYAREYTHGVRVLVKVRKAVNSPWDSSTTTSHPLGGNYRKVGADGGLGPTISSVSLMNNEAAILVKAE